MERKEEIIEKCDKIKERFRLCIVICTRHVYNNMSVRSGVRIKCSAHELVRFDNMFPCSVRFTYNIRSTEPYCSRASNLKRLMSTTSVVSIFKNGFRSLTRRRCVSCYYARDCDIRF